MTRRTRERDALTITEAELAGRRTPAQGAADAGKAPAILAGLIVDGSVSRDDIELELKVREMAAETVRVHNGKQHHKCMRKKKSDPPCTHPMHWKDVALMRGDFMKLGLDGSAGLGDLGDE